MTNLRDLTIVIKGAGEMASGVAWRLYMANLRRILMLDIAAPLAVRRAVSFCEALHAGSYSVEGVSAEKVAAVDEVYASWERGRIAVAADPQWHLLEQTSPQVVVDAILAKKNLGTRLNEAELVIALGPGFYAGDDVHMVIETNRGHDLGRVITSGTAQPNTGTPGSIAGYTQERVLRAPAAGQFVATKAIGDIVGVNETIGTIADLKVCSQIDGVVRGLIRSGVPVTQGLKIGDVDPRGQLKYCDTISEKARAIGGSVLEAVLRVFNQ